MTTPPLKTHRSLFDRLESPYFFPSVLGVALLIGPTWTQFVGWTYLIWFGLVRAPQIVNLTRVSRGQSPFLKTDRDSPFYLLYVLHRAAPWVILMTAIVIVGVVMSHVDWSLT